MPLKRSPFRLIRRGIAWLLKTSQIISRYAPIAMENSSVLSLLSAKLPTLWCPRKIKSASTVIAMRVSYLSMIALVSNWRRPPVLNSWNCHPFGSASPSVLSRRTFLTMASIPARMATMSESSVSHMFMPSGAVNTGKPARSLSIPIPSISCMRRLKYQDRYAFLSTLRPSGLFFRLFVRNNRALSIGIVYRPKFGGGICVIPVRLSLSSYSH